MTQDERHGSESTSQPPREELEAQREDLEFQIAAIKGQIEAAHARVYSEGTYADPDWYRRARFALRMKGAQHQHVLRELGRASKAVRVAHNSSRERQFVKVAKRRLAQETYESIWAEVDGTDGQ